MYRDMRVGVVVPAYNESELVATVVETMPEFVDRVYVVDDCSTDDTWEHVQRVAERENGDASDGEPGGEVEPENEESDRAGNATVAEPPKADGGVDARNRVVAMRHEENQGVGGAVSTGYERALADGVDAVAVMNGDAQMDPDELPRLLDPIAEGRADYAKGNRLLESEFREGMTRWRLLGNWSLTLLTKIASGYWKTMDPQNGYTAISREALETLGPSNLYRGYGFCNDVLVRLNVHDFTVADVPMSAVYGDETSSIAYSSFVPNLSSLLLDRFLWRLRVKYTVRDFHPLVLFYLFGAVSVLAGAVSGAASVLLGADEDGEIGTGTTATEKAGTETAATPTATETETAATETAATGSGAASTGIVAAAVLVPVGCLALLVAMTLDMLNNEDREVRAE